MANWVSMYWLKSNIGSLKVLIYCLFYFVSPTSIRSDKVPWTHTAADRHLTSDLASVDVSIMTTEPPVTLNQWQSNNKVPTRKRVDTGDIGCTVLNVLSPGERKGTNPKFLIGTRLGTYLLKMLPNDEIGIGRINNFCETTKFPHKAKIRNKINSLAIVSYLKLIR